MLFENIFYSLWMDEKEPTKNHLWSKPLFSPILDLTFAIIIIKISIHQQSHNFFFKLTIYWGNDKNIFKSRKQLVKLGHFAQYILRGLTKVNNSGNFMICDSSQDQMLMAYAKCLVNGICLKIVMKMHKFVEKNGKRF